MATDTFTIEREGEEIEVEVEFSIRIGRPATGPSYACGGEPAEPDEVEVASATEVLTGEAIDLTDAEAERIETQILEDIGNYIDDAEADYPEPDFEE